MTFSKFAFLAIFQFSKGLTHDFGQKFKTSFKFAFLLKMPWHVCILWCCRKKAGFLDFQIVKNVHFPHDFGQKFEFLSNLLFFEKALDMYFYDFVYKKRLSRL